MRDPDHDRLHAIFMSSTPYDDEHTVDYQNRAALRHLSYEPEPEPSQDAQPVTIVENAAVDSCDIAHVRQHNAMDKIAASAIFEPELAAHPIMVDHKAAHTVVQRAEAVETNQTIAQSLVELEETTQPAINSDGASAAFTECGMHTTETKSTAEEISDHKVNAHLDSMGYLDSHACTPVLIHLALTCQSV